MEGMTRGDTWTLVSRHDLLRIGERRLERIGVARDQRVSEIILGALLFVK